MNEIVNIAAYKFVALDDLPARRETLREECRRLGLKGTILLAEEGINLFLAGTTEAIDAILDLLRSDPAFADLEPKVSYSATQPFKRMWVKIKTATIPFGDNSWSVQTAQARRISPREFKQWLDEGRDVGVLDVRNTFEFAHGTFENAQAIGIDDFRAFPIAAEQLPEDMKRRPVVTFCTGGIRCEKAAPYLEQLGFEEVYQLDGGILKYFEECGGAHYRGTCFVFDERVALDAALRAVPGAEASVSE
ncbi:MAG: rhodanese-like domain-containing protein [Phycisphaerae bacterium]